MKPRLAVSVGCPSGIGPEVSVRAAVDIGGKAAPLLVGDFKAIALAARAMGVLARRLVKVASPSEAWSIGLGRVPVWQPTASLARADRRPGHPTARSGGAELAWVDAACDLVSRKEADAIVTGPVSKEMIARSRAPGSKGFLGHTEHLAKRLGAAEVVMAFAGPKLTTALVTTHLAIADVPRAITKESVARAVFWLGDFLARLQMSRAPRKTRKPPRVVVCGLNPHAGEAGLLGREETTRIAPGMRLAAARLARAGRKIDLEGPVPAEAAFRLAVKGEYDGVVAMYHDQATIPMKLTGFGEAVNVSLGLPIVRTSTDHGTAYDRAGKGTADPRGMRAALLLAAELVSAAGGS